LPVVKEKTGHNIVGRFRCLAPLSPSPVPPRFNRIGMGKRPNISAGSLPPKSFSIVQVQNKKTGRTAGFAFGSSSILPRQGPSDQLDTRIIASVEMRAMMLCDFRLQLRYNFVSALQLLNSIIGITRRFVNKQFYIYYILFLITSKFPRERQAISFKMKNRLLAGWISGVSTDCLTCNSQSPRKRHSRYPCFPSRHPSRFFTCELYLPVLYL
jgi:hypothetical protein